MTTDLVLRDPVIVRLMQAGTTLTEAKTIQQTKKIIDIAAAAEIYAKRQQLGDEAEGIALSVKIDALRHLGEILKETPKNEGARGVGKSGVPNRNPTLGELGLDKKTSSVAQKLAALPNKAFEQVREGHETVARAIAAVKKTKPATRRKEGPPADFVPLEKYKALEDDMEELREKHNDLVGLMSACEAVKNDKAVVEIMKLREDLRICQTRRNELMAQAVEMRKTIAYWKRKAEKK